MFGFSRKSSQSAPTAPAVVSMLPGETRKVEAGTVVHARKISARFDAAQSTPDNIRHWSNADGLSADAALSSGIRRTIRNRSRYELANNSYARGIVDTLADYVVGSDIRLQTITDDKKLARRIERAWQDWSDEVNLVDTLAAMKRAKTGDGEGFLALAQNNRLESQVKLSPMLLECDRVTNPAMVSVPNNFDGIQYDSQGNIVLYQVLKRHPGGDIFGSGTLDFINVNARNMIHWPHLIRPEQHRGIPELTPALGLFAELRRYTAAVIAAAETAADFAAVIESSAAAGDETVRAEAFDVVELEKRMATVLPYGYKLGQLKAEQPATTYEMFKSAILNEIARCLKMPYNIAALNSKDYNYSSGRLDHQAFQKAILIERSVMIRRVLSKIFREWLREMRLVNDDGRRFLESGVRVKWFFDGFGHVDPQKEAKAQQIRLQNRTTTLAREYGNEGLDWEEELEQTILEEKREKELRKKHNMELPENANTN